MILEPYKTFNSGNDKWFLYSPSQTGLWTVSLEDGNTGVITSTSYANRNTRAAAHTAWAGARHSRAPGTGPEIMHEMGMKGVNPDEKLDEMFRTYGHASVGDMARIMVHVDNVPMHLPLAVFNASAVNSGQEKSTRYQRKFGNATLHGLRHYLPEEVLRKHPEFEEEYQRLGSLSLELFNKFKPIITDAFVEHYKPENDKEKASLDSRVLDCVRFFLLTGQCSGFAFETSARDWSRVVSYLKASPFDFYHQVGEQITNVLTNEEAEKRFKIKHQAPGLLRHTEADATTNKVLDDLESILHGHFEPKQPEKFATLSNQDVVLLPAEYTEGQRMLAQYMLNLWPGTDWREIFDFLDSNKSCVEQAIFAMTEGFDHHHEMPFGEVTRLTAILESSIGEVRDFNRHRAVGRFIPMPLMFGLPYTGERAFALMNSGFTLPSYIDEIPKFAKIKEDMTKDFENYYEKAEGFMRHVYAFFGDTIENYGFMVNVLPLATRLDIWMHLDPKQANYISHLRTRNGGHINYRRLTWELNQLIADSDPFLNGIKLPPEKMPDPVNREQFFDRS